MKKSIIFGAVIVLILAGFGYYLVQHSTKKSSNSTDSSSTQSMATSPSSTVPVSATSNPSGVVMVAIQNFAFTPANITVKKGATVIWTNQDNVQHSVVFSSGSHASDTEKRLGKDESVSVIFNETGTFKYICGVHPSMQGSVTVTE